MSLTDSIADLLTRIRNASQAKHKYTDVSWSKHKESIVKVLKSNGLIENYLVKQTEQGGKMRIFLKYDEKRLSVIHGLKRISKPSCRRYISCSEIPFFYGGLGVPILSTSKGVLSGREARDKKVGGELICLAW